MPFSPTIKQGVSRRAHYRCCICHNFGIDIHHIEPLAENGPDTEDNAAPLCPSCHRTYGENRVYRAQVRGARDLWYDICDRQNPETTQVLLQLNQKLEQVSQAQSKAEVEAMVDSALDNAVSVLKEHLRASSTTLEDAKRDASEVISAVTISTIPSPSIQPRYGANEWEINMPNRMCQTCGYVYKQRPRDGRCPECGNPLP